VVYRLHGRRNVRRLAFAEMDTMSPYLYPPDPPNPYEQDGEPQDEAEALEQHFEREKAKREINERLKQKPTK